MAIVSTRDRLACLVLWTRKRQPSFAVSSVGPLAAARGTDPFVSTDELFVTQLGRAEK